MPDPKDTSKRDDKISGEMFDADEHSIRVRYLFTDKEVEYPSIADIETRLFALEEKFDKAFPQTSDVIYLPKAEEINGILGRHKC